MSKTVKIHGILFQIVVRFDNDSWRRQCSLQKISLGQWKVRSLFIFTCDIPAERCGLLHYYYYFVVSLKTRLRFATWWMSFQTKWTNYRPLCRGFRLLTWRHLKSKDSAHNWELTSPCCMVHLIVEISLKKKLSLAIRAMKS